MLPSSFCFNNYIVHVVCAFPPLVRDTPKFLRCQLSIVVTSDGKERTVLIGECGQENLYRYRSSYFDELVHPL